VPADVRDHKLKQRGNISDGRADNLIVNLQFVRQLVGSQGSRASAKLRLASVFVECILLASHLECRLRQ
jgi:hypothetical protein